MYVYDLIIIWDTGEKENHKYNSYEKAQEIETGFKKAFGSQIQYTCINRRFIL